MARCFYGLAKQSHLRDICVSVCGVLGCGDGGYAVDLLLETAAQETHCGQLRDSTPNGAGRGIVQIDPIGFNDVVQRARPADVTAVFNHFGIDLKTLRHDALDFSPLAAVIICRLFYKLKPDAIPATLLGRAAYWKKHYNTASGKGSVGEYINNAGIYASVC